MPFLSLLLALSFSLYPAQTAYAEPYNATPSVLVAIAQCESGGRQFDDFGRVIQSKTRDFGLYQINLSHRKEALNMGYDIMTTEGNISYALYLYHTRGTNPWISSEGCWKGASAP